MSENTAGDFFQSNHARLTRIASWANFFAWVVLVIYTLSTVQEAMSVRGSNAVLNIASKIGDIPNFFEIIIYAPLFAFGFVVYLATIFLRGVVFALVLKGISLGLNMIVETDLNYREKALEGRA